MNFLARKEKWHSWAVGSAPSMREAVAVRSRTHILEWAIFLIIPCGCHVTLTIIRFILYVDGKVQPDCPKLLICNLRCPGPSPLSEPDQAP